MTNITEIIDQAAKKYCACGMDKGCVHKTAFTAGVEWASTDPEMMKAMLLPFLKWYREGPGDTWLCGNEVLTTDQLISKYITDKQKEDETGNNS